MRKRLARTMRGETMTYTHRNGETDAPTVPGNYWFNGQCDGDIKEMLPVISDWHGGVLAWRPMYGDGWYEKIARFTGQWWGPVNSPWEVSLGK